MLISARPTMQFVSRVQVPCGDCNFLTSGGAVDHVFIIRHKPNYSLLVHLIIITTVDKGLLLCQLRLHVPPRPSCSSLSAQLSGATVDYSSARTSANLIRSSLDNNAGSSGSAKAAALIDVDGGGSDNHGVETVRSLPTNWKA